jgi:RNA polymerase sigma-70 factor (ECF subfamily)
MDSVFHLISTNQLRTRLFQESEVFQFTQDLLKESAVVGVSIFVEQSRMAMAARPNAFIPTRESLLSRLKDWEDRDSWRDFFETYWRLIYNTARKAGLTDAEAQDIVQETVISVARNIEGFKYDPAVCSFKTWMLRLTRWQILNQLKKRQKPGTVGPSPSREASCPLPTSSPDSTDRTPAIEQIPDPAGFDLETIWDAEWEDHLLTAAMERIKRRVDPEQLQLEPVPKVGSRLMTLSAPALRAPGKMSDLALLVKIVAL